MFDQREISDHQLRHFGLSLVAMLFTFAGIAKWGWQTDQLASLLAVIAAFLGAVYYLVPKSQRKIHHGFRMITRPIQIVMSLVALALVYYVVLTPIGLMMRLRGMGVRANPTDHSSYWVDCKGKTNPARYFDTY